MSADYSAVKFTGDLEALESDLRSGSTRTLLAARGLLGSGQPSKYQGYLEKLQNSREQHIAIAPSATEIKYLGILKKTVDTDRKEASIFAKAGLFAITTYAAVSVGMYFADHKVGIALSITLSAALVVMALMASYCFHSNNKSKDHYYLEHKNLSEQPNAAALDYDFQKHSNITESVSTFSGRFFLRLGGATSKNLDALAWKQEQINNINDPTSTESNRLKEIIDTYEGNAKIQSLCIVLPLLVCGGLAIGASNLTLRIAAACVGVLAMGLGRMLLSAPEGQKGLDEEHARALSPS